MKNVLSRWSAFVLLLLMTGAVQSAQNPAEQPQRRSDHALLVGVSEYPYLGPEVQLLGPRNDVILWRDFLVDRGMPPDAMHILADGVAGAGMPTRSAILDALGRLAEEAEDGDTVFLLFAGHGAQQPATEDTIMDEPDGLDEIFLPRDARGWNAPRQAVENAILDVEFKDAIDAIRNRGAFVWAVFDTCHSATMTRAVRPEGFRYRQARAESLGIPENALREARQRAAEGAVRSRGHSPARQPPITEFSANARGGLVAFYAAQSTQETPEFLIPPGSEHARDHGIFSYTLYQVLSDSQSASYRQIVESVIQRYQSMPAVSSVPMAEGTDLDKGVFGADAAGPRQWRMTNDGRRLRIAGGELQQLGAGSILAVVRDATDDDAGILGHVEVESTDLTSAQVRPVAYDGMDAAAVRDFPAVTFVRPVSIRVDFTLRVQLRGGSEDDDCNTPDPVVRDAIHRLQEGDSEVIHRLQWVSGQDAAPDAWLCQTGPRLYLVDGNTPVDAETGEIFAPSFAIGSVTDKTLAEQLSDAFSRLAKVRNLLRISHQTGGVQSSVRTEMYVRSVNPANDPPCDVLQSPQAREGSRQHDAGVLLELREGDCISLFVTNRSRQTPVDVTILFVDANFGITPLWPTARQLNNARIEGGGRIGIGEFEAYPDTLGRDQLIVLAVPVHDASQPTDLSFLAQESIAGRTRGQSRDGSVEDLLMDAGFGDTRTRGLRPPARGGSTLDAVVFPTRVLPGA